MIGNTILQFKILEKLGEGGMGEVYKAKDTKLDRLVALKFLPSKLAAAEDDKARFIREAKAASAINHPNVCTIYDIQETPFAEASGVVTEGQLFIVMEYVDGTTLKVKKDTLSEKQIIETGIQIAEGLAAAHEKGVVHRDIKPDNIMIRKDGIVQIMDFGLAKIRSVTEVSHLTKIGTTIGTMGYMSPEQIQGFEVDYRSDIFSLGIILYELLTGESPFQGVYNAAVIYKIVNVDPLPVSTARKDIDPLLDLIILRCLEKDKEKRYQSSKELAEDLSNLKVNYKKEDVKHLAKIKRKLFPVLKPGYSTSISPSDSIKIKRTKKKFIWIGLVIIFLIFTIGYDVFSTRRSFKVNPAMKIHELITPYINISKPSISADGNWIAFPAQVNRKSKWDIYLMHSKTGESRRITFDTTDFISYASISPDGSKILYKVATYNNSNIYSGNFYVASTISGNIKKIAEEKGFAAWSPDGNKIGFAYFGSFWITDIDGSNPRIEFQSNKYKFGRFSFSPDGNSAAVISYFKEGYSEIFIRKLGSDTEKQLTFDKKWIFDVYWTRNGVILFLSNKSGELNLYMIPENGGNEVQITKGNGTDQVVTASSDLSKILTYQASNYSNIIIKNLKTSVSKQITFDKRFITNSSFSPDRKLIAYCQYKNRTEWLYNSDVYVMSRNGSHPRQITSDNAHDFNVLFSPDGKYIAYTQIPKNSESDTGKIFIVKPDGSELPKFITKGSAWMWVDNKSLVINKNIYSLTRVFPSETEIVSIDGGGQKKIYKDSTMAFPVASGKLIFFIDLHHDDNFFNAYQISSKYRRDTLKYFPHYLFNLKHILNMQVNQNYFYWLNNKSELWRYNYLSGKKEIIGNYPGIEGFFGAGFGISDDDKEMILLRGRLSTKMIMIENAIIKN